MWIHLQLIKELKDMCQTLFGKVEYAFTTIPTYPSGQIGFMVCAKNANRDLRKPLRSLKGCRYYNEDVHRAAFVLPEFGRAMLQDGNDVRPLFGRSAIEAKLAGGKRNKILLLGSGFVALPCAEYITRNPENELTIGE